VALKQRLQSVPGLRLLGPMEAPVARLKDRWRWQLLAKAPRREILSEALRQAPPRQGGPVSLDRDPLNFTT